MPGEIHASAAPGPTITSSGTNSDGSRLIPGRTLQGKNVLGHSGDVLGTISDVIIDPATAHVIYYVVGLGGGEADLHPVPVARLEYDHAREAYISDLSREQIEAAPRQHDDWYQDQAWQQKSHAHYGVSRP